MAYQADKETRVSASGRTENNESGISKPVITVDYERYAHFLKDSDLTEDQKREFLQALWNIIVEFVSLGFGVHPLQQAKNTCGQLKEDLPKPALTAPDTVYLDDKLLVDNFGEDADQLGEGFES